MSQLEQRFTISQLEQLFTKYGTDKGIWGYTPVYEEHLKHKRGAVRHVLEIGICGFRDIPNNVVGASLFAWRDYFPHAAIHGIDNDEKFIFAGERGISTELADAYQPESLFKAITKFGNVSYDFICDDAVHDPMPQLFLVNCLWPFLKRGGVYAIEEACPYKLPNNNIEVMIQPMLKMFPDMHAQSY